ncbi:LRR receptor-like serine threonine- kinase GSO1 [Olea europaea subsp. europaea]|uniref:LRR receptor-like serine threonine- kinase GSO1 n=1 Tax=Olea europaea subsp. europaea TaxID=158383 RepID=A0A8S0SWG6_OLEEU|nr:LRR receptor-like serine threonine- kinase GSO1 [Olea europaea subsp. europaea]
MGSLPMNCLLLAFTILLQINGFHGCIEEERRGLLEIKTNFRMMNGDTMLLSWIHGKESNCCNWERVTCDPTTGRVVELDLNNLHISNTLDTPDYFLNVSLFSPFKEIRILDLSENYLRSSANTTGFIKLVHLKRLNLAFNWFNNGNFKSLSALKQLKFLNLSQNNFGRLLPVQDLSALWNLEILDLSYNKFKGNLSLQDPISFKNLKVLDLSDNNFMGSVPQIIGLMSSLSALSLAYNNLTGFLPSKEPKVPNLSFYCSRRMNGWIPSI